VLTQGRNDGDKGGTKPRASNYYAGAEKSQQCREYFLHYSTFASKTLGSKMGAPNSFLAPGAI